MMRMRCETKVQGHLRIAQPPISPMQTESKADAVPPSFLFCTGIENSIPTIEHGSIRIDQMDQCGHYRRWQDDFDAVTELGIHFLRYGPALHRTYLGPGRYDWEFADLALGELQRRGIICIADLCHFGVPDWIGNFQNPDFPQLFCRYCGEFARRYPHVQLYTPINEMFICALFSARYGWWNEQLADDKSFVNALKNIVKANILGMEQIVKVQPHALFIQSESTEYFHASDPDSIKPAELKNAQRFLSLDLNYGRRIDSEMYEYLLDNGFSRADYHFFLEHNFRHQCIMGNDYYITNEHRVYPNGHTDPAGEVFGYDEITRQYYDRYLLPVMHTETNVAQGENGNEAVYWLWKEWANVLRVRNDGVPIVGFTWYSLTDQIDWDVALRERRGQVHPVGLYDLDRRIRPVGTAYKRLIEQWKNVLPTRSICLQLPILPARWQSPAEARAQNRES